MLELVVVTAAVASVVVDGVVDVPTLRTAKLDAVPNDGADRAPAEWSFSMLALSEGALMRDAESLLHAAVSSANATSAPAANLCGASVRARRIGTLCAYMWASLGLWWFSVS
jgi:hypothetical protein